MEPNAYYYFLRAQSKLASGDEEGGLADLDRAIYMEEDNALYYLERGEYWFLREKPDKAINDLSVYIDVTLKDLRHAIIMRSLAYEDIGLAAKEVEDLDFLIKNGLADFNHLARAGNLKSKLGDFDEGIASLKIVYETAENPHEKIMPLVLAYYAAGQYDEAIYYITKLLEIVARLDYDQKIWWQELAYIWLGKVYSKLGRFDEAIEKQLEACSIGNKSEESLFELSKTHYMAHQYDDAIARLNELLVLIENGSFEDYEVKEWQERAWLWLGRSFYQLQNHNEALNMFRKYSQSKQEEALNSAVDYMKKYEDV